MITRTPVCELNGLHNGKIENTHTHTINPTGFSSDRQATHEAGLPTRFRRRIVVEEDACREAKDGGALLRSTFATSAEHEGGRTKPWKREEKSVRRGRDGDGDGRLHVNRQQRPTQIAADVIVVLPPMADTIDTCLR